MFGPESGPSPKDLGLEKETYYRARWQELQGGPVITAVTEGRAAGVPQTEIDRLVQEVKDDLTRADMLGPIYYLEQALEGGDLNRFLAFCADAYTQMMKKKEFLKAQATARAAWGIESTQFKRATQLLAKESPVRRAQEDEREEDEDAHEVFITLPRTATFKTLFDAIDRVEQGKRESGLHFNDELVDNFDESVAREVVTLREDPARAANTKVIDFFKKRGYSASDITTFLPIKFKR